MSGNTAGIEESTMTSECKGEEVDTEGGEMAREECIREEVDREGESTREEHRQAWNRLRLIAQVWANATRDWLRLNAQALIAAKHDRETCLKM